VEQLKLIQLNLKKLTQRKFKLTQTKNQYYSAQGKIQRDVLAPGADLLLPKLEQDFLFFLSFSWLSIQRGLITFFNKAGKGRTLIAVKWNS